MTYGVMMDSNNRNQRLNKQKLHCPLLQLAQDMNISEIKNNDKRNKRRLLLIFPDNVVLANVFQPNSAVLKYAIHTDKAPPAKDNGDPYITCHLVWRVVNMESHRRAIVDADDVDDIDVIAQQLASM